VLDRGTNGWEAAIGSDLAGQYRIFVDQDLRKVVPAVSIQETSHDRYAQNTARVSAPSCMITHVVTPEQYWRPIRKISRGFSFWHRFGTCTHTCWHPFGKWNGHNLVRTRGGMPFANGG